MGGSRGAHGPRPQPARPDAGTGGARAQPAVRPATHRPSPDRPLSGPIGQPSQVRGPYGPLSLAILTFGRTERPTSGAADDPVGRIARYGVDPPMEAAPHR